MDTFSYTFGVAKKLHYIINIFFKSLLYLKSNNYDLGVPYGRAIHFNRLFPFSTQKDFSLLSLTQKVCIQNFLLND